MGGTLQLTNLERFFSSLYFLVTPKPTIANKIYPKASDINTLF